MSEPTTVFLVGRRDASKRLDHFLKEKIPGLSRSRIQQAIRERVTLSWEVEAARNVEIVAKRMGYVVCHKVTSKCGPSEIGLYSKRPWPPPS